jgi:hypothetical protein
MNKFYGINTDFHFIREDRITIIASYGQERVDETHCTWYEVYFDKRKTPKPTIEQIKEAVTSDINAQTDEKILHGMIWTPASGGDAIPVWLSTENQFNFKSAYDLAVQTNGATLPVTFKMGEDEEGNPIYHTFETMEDANDFYLKAVAHINQCLNEGWQRKDSIDWNDYKAFFPKENNQE